MADYFGFRVQYVMNITDVDDKIILRGRQQYLLQRYKSTRPSDLSTTLQALSYHLSKNLQYSDPNAAPVKLVSTLPKTYHDILSRDSQSDTEAKTKMHIKTALAAAGALKNVGAGGKPTNVDDIALDEILMPYLDHEEGKSVDAKDHSIFTGLTQRYEERFTKDMRDLNVLDPDQLIRVSESVPQIVEFVEGIERNGFAYQTSKGVYFDVEAFEKADNYYARLEPWNRNDAALQADGEGAITGKESKGDPEKRSQADFALWKLSKPGEPSWPSPWGEGRPGWHIECSAMASEKLGNKIDIHSGGVDLAFPHHDNELAQSEAYWVDKAHKQQHQWVNYFLHMGHLSISGAKMSKSLKNFTTIRDALTRGVWTSRQLRIVLLLGSWKDSVEITDELKQESVAWEGRVNEFFIKVRNSLESAKVHLDLDEQWNKDPLALAIMSTDAHSLSPQKEKYPDPLEVSFQQAKEKVHNALADSFHTRIVMSSILELITKWYSAGSNVQPLVSHRIARWITAIVNMFGLNGTARPTDVSLGWSGLDVSENARPALVAISSLRDEIRGKAKNEGDLTLADIHDAVATSKQQSSVLRPDQPFADVMEFFQTSLESIVDEAGLQLRVLRIADEIRDKALFDRDIDLEDQDGNKPALIKPLTKEKREERKAKEERELQKAKAKRQREAEAAQRKDQGRLKPSDMFKVGAYLDQFREWDAAGLPTKDKEGNELAKSRTKKLKKEWEAQTKKHAAWLKEQGT
ncbi:uncharacterized protein KY384_005149 [Bacidia gigantensis]|uniref:uncharacterized protein n=1 Tax=Bacidia gigantensis TaxID=2732470 RepID=UPI001D04086A|nr:uncharacterized protein KY384_005149 [Bacidia gigantensis]KAG8529668.1 hypothetical protein KY384_005149 [Bacidia gigantensis]